MQRYVAVEAAATRLTDILSNMQAVYGIFYIGRLCFVKIGTRRRVKGGQEIIESFTENGDRPSGIAKIPRARFVIRYATVGALVSKEWRTQKYRPFTYLPTYPYLCVRARILSGCLHRYTTIVVVLEMVAIFARSWQEDNETRPDTRYTTTLSWFSPASLSLSFSLSLSLSRLLAYSLSSAIHPSTIVLPIIASTLDVSNWRKRDDGSVSDGNPPNCKLIPTFWD